METDSSESMNPPAGDFKAPMPMAPPMGLPVAFGSKKPVQPKKRPPPIQKTDNNKKPTKNEEKEELDPNQPKFKHAETAEEKERTVYVSNMDYKLKNPEKELKKIFVGCGEIEEFRMVKNGVLFRGYGYVLFKEKKGHDNALLRDRTKINGRPCFVSKFSEPGDSKNKKGTFWEIIIERSTQRSKRLVLCIFAHFRVPWPLIKSATNVIRRAPVTGAFVSKNNIPRHQNK